MALTRARTAEGLRSGPGGASSERLLSGSIWGCGDDTGGGELGASGLGEISMVGEEILAGRKSCFRSSLAAATGFCHSGMADEEAEDVRLESDIDARLD